MVWGNVPQRNKNFTGRSALLRELRDRVTADVTAVLPHALQGLGGVGKTQLAIEYAYLYAPDYEVVWWVPADQPALVRSSLAALAPRLNITSIAPGRVEDAVSAVLDTLRRGEPYRRWLLIFDNADQPEMIREWIPHGGHILVTSRNHRWQSMADTVEVDVFSREESREFLHRRVIGIGDADALRLAEELGDLPLALEQAGALQAETGMSVAEYLELLNKEAGRLLAENPPADYPVPVAAAWSLSVGRLREQMPFALELLRRCAFFGPEPIHRDLLTRGRYVLDSPLRDALSDNIQVSRAIRELGRYALARIDNNRKTLHVHRLIQKLIRDELTQAEAEFIRHEVHLLLAAADPDDPDELEHWEAYSDLLVHIGPSGIVGSAEPAARLLVCNIVRYLYDIGDTSACLAQADAALAHWIEASGLDDRHVLIMNRRKADVLWALGRFPEAYDLRRDTLDRMRQVLGPDDEQTLLIINGHGADLRVRGDFAAARALDEDSLPRHSAVFGDDQADTFLAANNLALDYELNSEYTKALRRDEMTYRDRLIYYGRDDHPMSIFSLNSLARDMRQAGRYGEACRLAERAHELFRQVVRRRILPPNHTTVLLQAKDLSVARRLAGDVAGALELARDVHERYSADFPPDHPDRLAAAVNLANAERRAGDPDRAAELIEEAVARHAAVLGEDHPYTHACTLNLAIVLRQRDPAAARDLLERALRSLTNLLGPDHHYTLTCTTSLATVLADLGEHQSAYDLDRSAVPRLRSLLGSEHPHTIMCEANQVLDLRALHRDTEADELFTGVVARYGEALGPEHPDVRAVIEHKRVDVVFEPSPL